MYGLLMAAFAAIITYSISAQYSLWGSKAKNLRNVSAVYFIITIPFMVNDHEFIWALIVLGLLFMIGGSWHAQEKAHEKPLQFDKL